MSVALRPVPHPGADTSSPRPAEPERAGATSQEHGGENGPPAGAGSPASPRREVLHVVAWHDPVVDDVGYDPRSLYVETFWLGVIGPTATWLMRRLAARLDDEPGGFDLDTDDTARTLGVGTRPGRHSPFRRAVARCMTFELARPIGAGSLAVRRRMAPLPRRHLQRLPPSLQDRHERWMAAARRSPALDEARRRARRLALGLVAAGGPDGAIEPQLLRWRVHPALTHEAAAWARLQLAHADRLVPPG